MKNGDCLKGILEKVDNFMNLKLKDIIYTPEGSETSMKIKESYVRGNNINSMQFREGLIEKIEEEKELSVPNLPRKKFLNFNF
jgi:U6 snRNA-associated Sm-like protein LSm4